MSSEGNWGGFWSSHPDRQRRRLRLFNGLAFLVLLLIASGWIAGIILGFLSVGSLGSSLRWMALVGMAFFSVCAHAALTARWGEMQCIREVRGADTGSWSWGPWMIFFMVAATVGIVAPTAITRLRLPGWRMVFGFHLLPFIPITALLIFTASARGIPRPTSRWLRHGFRLLFAMVVMLLAVSLVYDLAVVFDRNNVIRTLGVYVPWYQDAQRRFFGLLWLAPVFSGLVLLWSLWSLTGTSTNPAFGSAEETDGKDTQDSNEPPAWLVEVRNAAMNWADEVSSPVRWVLADKEVSRPAGGGTLHQTGLLEDRVPTESQELYFGRFVNAYQDAITDGMRAMVGERAQQSKPGADILIHGPNGSGRTDVLMASALYAALVRGQRVLLIVPDMKKGEHLCAALNNRLQHLQLHYYVSASLLSRASMQQWFRECGSLGQATAHDGMSDMGAHLVFPNILVAEPDGVERYLYGFPTDTDEEAFWMERLLTSLEVVIVDDLLQFHDIERSHIAFLIEKHRLLLASHFILQQTVVSCDELRKDDDLPSRLFGEKHKGSVILMRPRQTPPVWRMNVFAQNIDEALAFGVEEALVQGQNVLLYRRDLSDPQISEMRDLILRNSERRGSHSELCIVGDLDRIPGAFAATPAVFFHVGPHEDTAIGLRMRTANTGSSALVAVCMTGETIESHWATVSPVLVERDAQPMALLHLMSAQKHIRANLPVPLDYWKRLGIRETRRRRGSGTESEMLRLHVDECRDLSYGDRLWPYALVEFRNGRNGTDCIDVRALPEAHEDLISIPMDHNTGRVLRLVRRREEDRIPNRLIRWVSSSGEEMPTVDLLYLKEALLMWGGHYLAIQSIRNRDNAAELMTCPWLGPGRHATFPQWRLEWAWPQRVLFNLGGGSLDYGYEFLWTDWGSSDSCTVTLSMISRFTELGDISRMDPIEVRFRSNFTLMLLRPEAAKCDQESDLYQVFSGTWSTGNARQFWPELTGAVHYALDEMLPGLTLLSRPLAFDLGPEGTQGMVGAPAAAVIVFFDMHRSGRVANIRFTRFMDDPVRRRDLFLLMEHFLDRMRDHSQISTRLLRRQCRVAFEGDDSLHRIEQAFDLASWCRERSDDTVRAFGGMEAMAMGRQLPVVDGNVQHPSS